MIYKQLFNDKSILYLKHFILKITFSFIHIIFSLHKSHVQEQAMSDTSCLAMYSINTIHTEKVISTPLLTDLEPAGQDHTQLQPPACLPPPHCKQEQQ